MKIKVTERHISSICPEAFSCAEICSLTWLKRSSRGSNQSTVNIVVNLLSMIKGVLTRLK